MGEMPDDSTYERDARRYFSKKEKAAVEIVSGRKGHADHIHPWSKGGKTDVANCDLISPKANQAKGQTVFEPRGWQKRFLEDWDKRNDLPFLLIVAPGGGKTMAALAACKKWMRSGPDRRVVIVVPTRNLVEQWQEEALRFGIELQSEEFGTNFKEGFQGAVATYATIANQRLIFRVLCSRFPVMVVFDEVHHCGEDASYGDGIKDAFGLAKEKLLLSGTPWKTDGTPIPFVRYDDNGEAIGDFKYGLNQAIQDGIIRVVTFDYAKGTLVNETTTETFTLSSETEGGDAAFLLAKMLNPGGEFVKQKIRDAHRKLSDLRQSHADAGALAVCKDQDHAFQVARVIREETGCQPAIIVSDEEKQTHTVKDYRNGKTEWLVAVRKVSEGTDIKRLMVLCYLTNVTSDLFFRQVLGRIMRVRSDVDQEAYAFLPADPRLIEAAKRMDEEQLQGLKELADSWENEDRESQDERTKEKESDSVFSTVHNGTEIVIFDGKPFAKKTVDHAEAIAKKTGVRVSDILKLVASGEMTIGQEASAPQEIVLGTGESSLESQLKYWRNRCHKAAAYHSKLTGKDYKEVHKAFWPSQKHMNLEQLKAKYKTLSDANKKLQEAQRRA